MQCFRLGKQFVAEVVCCVGIDYRRALGQSINLPVPHAESKCGGPLCKDLVERFVLRLSPVAITGLVGLGSLFCDGFGVEFAAKPTEDVESCGRLAGADQAWVRVRKPVTSKPQPFGERRTIVLRRLF